MLNLNKKHSLINLCIISTISTFILFFSTSIKTCAEEINDSEQIIVQQARSGEMKKIEDQLKKYSEHDINEIIKGYNPENILNNAAKGEFGYSLKSILNSALNYLFKEIYININILVKLIVLVAICALLKNLQTSFLSESVGELAFYVCYIVLVSIIILCFNTALSLGINVIDKMVDFMYATVPVLITLLVSGGNITSGGVFQPILIMIVEVSATLIKNIFIPLVFMSTILSILNNISEKIQISKLASFLKQIANWSLGLILTVFIAIITIQGSVGAVADGIAGKTAKYAIGTFIPIVGSYLADATDTVLGCTLLIKNAAGIASMIGIIVICLIPLLKILALIALFKIACVLVEPISEKRITACLNEVSGSMTFIFGMVATVAVMFLISISAIIGASNLSAMIR